MKILFLKLLLVVISISFLGCSAIFTSDPMADDVANQKNYIKHFDKEYYEVSTSEDIEDVVIYMPQDSTAVRLKMKVSNLEDIIYMKLVTEDGFEIDKILRRVGDIKELGYEQDGYMYEPSIQRNVITLQVYVPSVYLYNGAYKPKLIFSFKRNSRSVQESVNLYFLKQKYFVSHDNNASQETPAFASLSDYCADSKKVDREFFTQMQNVSENRIGLSTIKDIENSCK